MSDFDSSKSIVLGITGASGTQYGLNLLEFLLETGHKVDLVISDNALLVAKLEMELNWANLNVQELKFKLLNYLFIEKRDSEKALTLERVEELKANLNIWQEENIAASIASGSYRVAGMIISPCSMGTLAHIAMGTSHNLISRAADVMLKERKKLILVVRETPFSTIHLKNMLSLSEAGAVILPAIPAFYHRPQTIQDQIDFITGKTLDSFGIDSGLFKRWR
ncbi:MAG: UbiX family flavin prenyltransferase [Candidatus Caenarcaniphilales bacterium]|nr:UbiX family flavin prenyltransferase [Candidatus Caenarcaniphilales bacterium]